MLLIYGRRLFGHVDRVPGHFFVATEFVHISYVALFPVQSWIVLSEDKAAGTFSGIKIPLDRRSLRAGWLRTGLLLLAWLSALAAALLLAQRLSAAPIFRRHWLTWAVPMVAAVVFYAGYRRSTRDELATPEQARARAVELGWPEEKVRGELLPALERATLPRASRLLGALVLVAGLAGLFMGWRASTGQLALGTAFPPVTASGAAARADGPWEQGHVTLACTLDRSRIFYDTTLSKPAVSLHPPDRTVALALDAAPERTAPLLGARVEVAGALEPAFRTTRDEDRPKSYARYLAPVAGSQRRIWVLSRWFSSEAADSALAREFLAAGHHSGRLARTADLESNTLSWPSRYRIQELYEKQGIEPPPPGSVVVHTASRYADSPDPGPPERPWAYFPVVDAPEPLLVQHFVEGMERVAPPVKGHLSRNILLAGDIPGAPAKGPIVLSADDGELRGDENDYRSRALLGVAVWLTLAGLCWPLLP